MTRRILGLALLIASASIIAGASSASAATWPVATHLQITAPPKAELGQIAQITAHLHVGDAGETGGAEETFK